MYIEDGSDSVRNRSSRAAVVCLVLLCVLLLTTVIVLCVTLTQERQQFISNNENLTNERQQLRNELQINFKYLHTRSWTESRRYCTERGTDLIIINNREENDFDKKMFGGTTAYTGLTDSDVEGRWKWVDGTNMISGLWGLGEPNGYIAENCGVIVDNDPRWPTLFGWHDVSCNRDFQWICEKRISLILP
ncbi:C-type lectin domain family 4 member E-like [Cyprinus carpio]|uniref:C-type lectin domain family 4 member E-like n=1 Tax=Cyprinus carpio TaxID=7962 RepID=A0A9Q9ZQG8_CYPCA|nr:C-type lectin domain family 4 member E-like [Cyprinus carpio]